MDFFTGANLVWIIGIISSIVAGLSALSKFRYQNKLELFKDTNVNLFKKEKEEVLAAISTLSVFKRDSRFEKHTTSVLLSRLYTELDYDITNAICSALIQYSNRQELLDISSEVLDINRNFFVQTYPVSQMLSDLNACWIDLNNTVGPQKKSWIDLNNTADPKKKTDDSKKNEEEDGGKDDDADLAKNQKQMTTDSPSELEKTSSKELLENYRQRSLTWIPKKRYELNWHKQITADTYSRILRRAYKSKPEGWNRIRKKLHKFFNPRKESNRFKELDMDFYQNDFNYVYMAGFKTSSCSIVRSAIGTATIVDVEFLNIECIRGTSFENTHLHNCRFRGGIAELNTSFKDCRFFKGKFENIYLKEVDFSGIKCEGVIFDGKDLNVSPLKMARCSFKASEYNSEFSYSEFNNCIFRNCYIESSAFFSCIFQNVLFENVIFSETYFCNSNLIKVNFVNCTGLSARHFYKYFEIDATTFPSQFTKTDIDGLEKTTTEKLILTSTLSDTDKIYLKGIFNPAPIT